MNKQYEKAAPRWRALKGLGRRTPRYDVLFYLPTMAKVLVDRREAPPSGGAETQVSILARNLAARGHRVAAIVFDLPGGVPGEVDGIDLYVRREYAGRLGREIGPLARILGAVTETLTVAGVGLRFPAKVIVQRTASVNTGLLSISCRITGKRFVWSSASDFDFQFENFSNSRAQFHVYKTGVRQANAVVVQTSVQAGLCQSAFGRTPHTIMSLAEPAEPERQSAVPGSILWIGRAIDYKGPMDFVAIAKENPELQFAMVVVPHPGTASRLFEEVEEASRKVPNLTFHGPLSRQEVLAMTAGAAVMANTSTFEGMPNVFLEGWARGVPAVSLNLDPDGVIERFGLGAVAGGSHEAFASAARSFVEDQERRAETGKRCMEYIQANHSPEAITTKWESALGLVSRGTASMKGLAA